MRIFIKNSRKGSVLDILVVIVIAITTVFGLYTTDVILTQFRASVISSPATNNTEMVNITDVGISALRLFDMGIPFIIVGLVIVSAIFAFETPTRPYLLIPAIFIWVFIIIASAQFSNMIAQFEAESTFAASVTHYPLTSGIVNNFPLLALVHGIIILIALYMGRSRGDVYSQF